ncbi:MAG: DUF512 domain-containing protein [Eubacteriales bacterium]|nr:DUF512 domain-containing protein [Eubacteriales bacterium]
MEKLCLQIVGVQGPAKKAGVQPGEYLLQIDGQPVLDFIDFNGLSYAENPTLLVRGKDGPRHVRIKKPQGQPLGLDLGDALYPPEKVCRNHCTFCFVDQMPAGMRDSLYVKDDDWRYSVLFNNFVTLTNLSDADFDRIIRRGASPLNVSVHCTDAAVRVALMRNPQAGQIMAQLKKLADGDIHFNCQAVLVSGVNDGDVLARSMDDLFGLYPQARTFAVVPVGLTCHRDGLDAVAPYTREQARAVVRQVEEFQKKAYAACGELFVYAADEFYNIAQLPYPRYTQGGYVNQLGNGVGLCSEFLDGVEAALDEELPARSASTFTIATGTAAAGLLTQCASALMARIKGLTLRVVAVPNRTFGPTVTVAGLLCGRDFIDALAAETLGDALIVPDVALRDDCFLDDMTKQELADRLNIPVHSIPGDGYDLVQGLCRLMEEQP